MKDIVNMLATVGTEAASTGVSTAGTAGFFLTVFGYVGTSTMLPILVSTLLISSGLVALAKFARVPQLLVETSQQEENKEAKKLLLTTEVGTGVILAATTGAASAILLGNATAQAAVAMTAGLFACPVLAVATLGLTINAWNDFAVNLGILQKLSSDRQARTFSNTNLSNGPHSNTLDAPSVDGEASAENFEGQALLKSSTRRRPVVADQSGDKDIINIRAASSLMYASFIKAIGYTSMLAGSTAIAASFAPVLVGAGLVGVAGSHLYNNRAHISFGLFSSEEKRKPSFIGDVLQRTAPRPL